MKKSDRLTLADLAKSLGLDKSTISLALRDSPKISKTTREQIQEAARKYGYVPNLAARQLSLRSPQLLSLVLPSSFATLLSQVAGDTVRFLVEKASEKGILFNIVGSKDVINATENFSKYMTIPDGLFIWGDVPAGEISLIEKYKREYVILDPSHISLASFAGPAVSIDNKNGGSSIVEYLIERGAERLLFVQLNQNHLGQIERWKGARESWFKKFPLEMLSYCLHEELTDAALQDFAKAGKGAIFCSNDWCAWQVWHRLQILGISVPQQVQLAGFDGDNFGSLIELTTAVFDGKQLAEVGFELLCSQFEKKETDPNPIKIPVRILRGKTTL